MWSLIYAGEDGTATARNSPAEVSLLCGPEYVVGRKNVDILLNEDPSISRKHATLSSSFNETQLSNPASLPILSMTDFSKFGTSVGENKMSGATCNLSDGDVIKFGQMHNVYRAKYTPFVVATSSLPSADKLRLKQCLLQLGAHQVNDWSQDCNLLVMGKVGVTVKAVCALASLKPIVTLNYIEKLVSALTNNRCRPSPESFTPVLAEEEQDKFLLQPKQQREELFDGRTFFFCNKSQFDKMKIPVELAGGKALLMSSKPRSLSQLTAKGAILMYCDTVVQPSWYKDCVTYLNRKSKRYIQDAEIGHAVLFCSTEKHCNPEQEAGSKLHEEFSQKMSNTQSMTQTHTPLPKPPRVNLGPSVNAMTSMIVPDSQLSTRSRAGDRSLHIKDVLPSPDVTNVAETQKQEEFAIPVKKEPIISKAAAVKRKSAMDTQSTEKRIKLPLMKDPDDTMRCESVRCDDDSAATVYGEGNSNTDGLRMSVNEESSHIPSMREVATPERSTVVSQTNAANYDVSVVEETQSSAASTGQLEEDTEIKPESNVQKWNTIKSEPVQQAEQIPKPSHLPNLNGFSEERKVEIGAAWDRIQVDFGSLLRKTKPPTFNSGSDNVPERRGMALWKGKWVPNFKRFKKCGKRDLARLPTIIGGGDLVDALCSQGDSNVDFLQAPTQENVRRREVIAPRPTAAKTTMRSSAFGGQWELPSTKK